MRAHDTFFTPILYVECCGGGESEGDGCVDTKSYISEKYVFKHIVSVCRVYFCSLLHPLRLYTNMDFFIFLNIFLLAISKFKLFVFLN